LQLLRGQKSADVAFIALSEILNGKDEEFWRLPYCPNKLIYETILDEYQKNKKDEFKSMMNRTVWTRTQNGTESGENLPPINGRQKYTRDGKVYRSTLLRNSYRVNGKIRHDTIANLSQSTDEEIEAIRLALKHKGNLKNIINTAQQIKTRQGLSVGAVWILDRLAKRLGISKALGPSREAKLWLWLVLATVI